MSTPLKPCPCGATPTALILSGESDWPRWGTAAGDCCGDWEVEFRNKGHYLSSDLSKAAAAEVWNKAKRVTAIPPEALDLIRFLCETWVEIDEWAYKNASPDALSSYPVIQGTSNQIKLRRIAGQPFDRRSIPAAVKWMQQFNQAPEFQEAKAAIEANKKEQS